ncbi:uncharacterized protein DS421_7g220220 [Arachis hypogaea]|nr:uncharacterized protein DS421_7g220220 [Arachis hypogaea]
MLFLHISIVQGFGYADSLIISHHFFALFLGSRSRYKHVNKLDPSYNYISRKKKKKLTIHQQINADNR